MMSKFKKGEKARVTRVGAGDIKNGVAIGDIVTIDGNDSYILYVILSNGKGHYFMERQLEPIAESPAEITINGVTYIRKHEPAHEWKFGDIAVHEDYGVGIVCSKPDENKSMRFVNKADLYLVYIEELTFLRRSDLSV